MEHPRHSYILFTRTFLFNVKRFPSFVGLIKISFYKISILKDYDMKKKNKHILLVLYAI